MGVGILLTMSESSEKPLHEPPVEHRGEADKAAESRGMPAEDADTLGRAVHEAARIDTDAQSLEAEYRRARRKALEILFYANEHIRHPCGGSPEEQAYQRKIHQQAVNEALLEPGILNVMTDEEVSHLNRLLRMK